MKENHMEYYATKSAFSNEAAPAPNQVVTKATLRAAEALGINSKNLGRILGVSEASVSRLKSGKSFIEKDTKAFELALLFLRLYRGLDAISGGDIEYNRAWLAHENRAFDAVPLHYIQSVQGLSDVLAYLDARRAKI